MKLELSDGMSNHSDFSNDSHNSQMSTANFMTSMGNGVIVNNTFITYEAYSGVPTITTPTLTPTTLRNIEQTFIEYQSKTEPHENEAGFVPPMVHPIGNNQYISASDVDVFSTKSNSNLWPSSVSQSSSDSNTRPTPPVTPKSGIATPAPQTRRNMGGRKPQKDVNVSPEEEERRRIRRERNKAAAARCRKRRVDHTNSLIEEVDQLEKKKGSLQEELEQMQDMAKQLEFALENHIHSHTCQMQDVRSLSPHDVKPYTLPQFLKPEERIKTEMIEQIPPDEDPFLPSPAKKPMLSSTVQITKPNRPNSLKVNLNPHISSKNVHEIAGIPIQTPSTGIQFNFESLMVGGTGLTPVTTPLIPNCSTQQRIPVTAADMSSPDSCKPPKLVSL